MSKQSRIKVCYFSGAWIRDMFFYLVKFLQKKPDKMILNIGTNDLPFYSATENVEEIGKLKQYILLKSAIVKLVISNPTLRTDKTNANLINIKVTEHLRTNEEKIITHPNTKEEHLNNKYGLYINNIIICILVKSLLLDAQAILHVKDSSIKAEYDPS